MRGLRPAGAAPSGTRGGHTPVLAHQLASRYGNSEISGDCSIATGADSKIARVRNQGESTWDPLNASELAPNSAQMA